MGARVAADACAGPRLCIASKNNFSRPLLPPILLAPRNCFRIRSARGFRVFYIYVYVSAVRNSLIDLGGIYIYIIRVYIHTYKLERERNAIERGDTYERYGAFVALGAFRGRVIRDFGSKTRGDATPGVFKAIN